MGDAESAKWYMCVCVQDDSLLRILRDALI